MFEKNGWLASCPDSMGRTSQYHCARQEGRTATEELNQPRHVKDHVLGRPVLHDFTVENGFYPQLVRIGYFVSRNEAGA